MSYEEQIMSKEKYPNIFRPKWRLLCLLSFKSFSQRENWGISFNWGILGHVICLDQSRASGVSLIYHAQVQLLHIKIKFIFINILYT